MNKYKHLAFILMILIIFSISVVSAEPAVKIIDEDKTENLHLVSENVQIDSTIYGDVYAITDTFVLNGVVNKDVVVVAQEFTQNGIIGDDLRLVAGKATLNSYIFSEVMIFAGEITITNQTIITGPVKIRAGTVQIDGEIRAKADIRADRIILNGIIQNDAVLQTQDLILGPEAVFKGDVQVSKGIEIDESKVYGEISYIGAPLRQSAWSGASLMGKLFFFLMIIILGTVMLAVMGKSAEKGAKIMHTRFFLSIILGLVILVCVPIISFMVFITIIGIPLAIIMMLLYIMLVILSMIFGALLLGRIFLGLFKGKKSLWVQLLLGAIILVILSFLGWVYILIVFILMLAGMGSLFLLIMKKEPKKKEKTKKETPKKTAKK